LGLLIASASASELADVSTQSGVVDWNRSCANPFSELGTQRFDLAVVAEYCDEPRAFASSLRGAQFQFAAHGLSEHWTVTRVWKR